MLLKISVCFRMACLSMSSPDWVILYTFNLRFFWVSQCPLMYPDFSEIAKDWVDAACGGLPEAFGAAVDFFHDFVAVGWVFC